MYQAVFSETEDGIDIFFPDLPGCLSCADTLDEALNNAQEALEGYILSCEDLDIDLPESSPIGSIKLKDNQVIYIINLWMPLLREQEENRSIKKTLTIPKWLNDKAVKENINFSHVLQSGLKNVLGIQK